MISKIMIKSFLINIILTFIKLVGGFIFKSKTLIADGVHSMSDMLTDIVGIVGGKLSEKSPDKEHPLGHGNIEYVTSIFISILIIIMSITIMVNSSIQRTIITDARVLIILFFSVVVKYLLSRYLINCGKKLESNILISSGSESKTDMMSSAFALVFVLLSFLGKYNTLFYYADFIGSIVIALMIFRIGLKLFIENIKSVIGEVDDNPIIINKIKKIVYSNLVVKKIRRITIIKHGRYKELTLELILNKNLRLKRIYKLEANIKSEIKSKIEEIKYVTINFQI